jgi:hypothetical protein
MFVSSLCFWTFCQGNLQVTHKNMKQLYQFATAASFPDIWALGTLHVAEGGTVRPPLGSARNGQAVLYLFQKHCVCWECTVYRSLMLGWQYLLITSLDFAVDYFVEFFMVLFFFRCLKEHDISSKLCDDVFETGSERLVPHALCFSTYHLPSRLGRVQANWWD